MAAGLAGTGIPGEILFVTVNDTQYGGAGGKYATYAGGNEDARGVAVHEVGHSFADLADELGLAEFLRVAGADSKRAPQELPSSREDALEALIGAIYLDSNLETTQGIVLRWYGDVKSRIDALNNAHNPKGRLQELLQPKISSSDIRYELIQESGPSHERLFRVELFIATQSCATGEGRSKKAAEEAAALKVLESFDSFDFSHA